MSGSARPAKHESAEQTIARLRHVQAPPHYTPAPGDTDWYHYTHQHLYAMLMSADPVAVHERAQTVQAYASHIDDTANAVVRAAQNMLGTWSGSAADIAAQNINQITAWADETTKAVGRIAQGFTDYASALDTARNSMPEPIDWGAVNKALSGGTVHLNTSGFNSATIAAIAAGKKEDEPEAKARELRNKQQAVEVMSRYHETSTSLAAAMPTLTAAPGVQPTGTIPVSQPPGGDPGPGPVHPTPPGTTTTSSAGPTSVLPPTTSGVGAGAYQPNAGGFGGGGLVNAHGGWGGFGSPDGTGAASGTGAAKAGGAVSGAAEEVVAGRPGAVRTGTAAAGEGEEGWGGFGGGGAGTGRGDDGEHRDKYADDSDLIGTLPEAFPPVLGG